VAHAHVVGMKNSNPLVGLKSEFFQETMGI
jgi:hypothetical protein